jgi:hypothetical protein
MFSEEIRTSRANLIEILPENDQRIHQPRIVTDKIKFAFKTNVSSENFGLSHKGVVRIPPTSIAASSGACRIFMGRVIAAHDVYSHWDNNLTSSVSAKANCEASLSDIPERQHRCAVGQVKKRNSTN